MLLPKVASIQDLSGIGRCSLSAALPVLSAMGVQACPLPTAVLSNQTGFESYAAISLTGQLADSIGEWQKQKVAFDAVSTGFLMDAEQADLVGGFLDYARQSGSVIIVDPVMGDGGSLYPIYDMDMCKAFTRLIAKADVITPNLTEACLLAGAEYPAPGCDHKFIWEVAKRLGELGPHTVVITGVSGEDEDMIYNMAYLARQNKRICLPNRKLGGSFSGTGDVLCAIVCGALARGQDIESALRLAGQLFEKAISLSLVQGIDPREGIAFEPFLHILKPAINFAGGSIT